MIALAVMVLAAGAMTAVYSYSQKEEKKQQENVADKDAGKDKGNKKEDGASDDFVATLPKTEEEETKTKEDSKYPYKTVDEAVAYIKELEKELADAKESNSENDAYVADLEAQAAQWKEYKENEQKFEEEKAKFYKEVVFSDQAPDINEYKKYYESIDPQNAENLYKQVVEQQEKDDDMSDYVKAYSQMKPKQAAAIFDTMTDNLELVAKILSAMKADARGDILGNMKTDTAAKVTKLMEP